MNEYERNAWRVLLILAIAFCLSVALVNTSRIVPTEAQYIAAYNAACQAEYETTECPTCRQYDCPMRPTE